MKYIAILLLVVVSSLQANAETIDRKLKENKFSIFTNIDLVSRHSWRGGLADETFSIEPMVEMNIGKLTLGVWGAATINQQYKELDLYVAFTPFEGLNLGIYDYYCPPSKLSDSKFGDFKAWHIFDAIATYNFKKIPLKITSATVLGGMDNEYSTYLEATYTQSIGKHNKLILLIAGTPHKGAYATKADFVNTELIFKHVLKLKKGVSMPIYARLVHNPHKNKTYFIAGISFSGTSLF